MFSLFRMKPTVERILISDPYFKEIAKLRYKTYCEELNFLDAKKYPDKEETDEYDGNSIHIAIKIGRRLAGYARIIFPRNGTLPVFEYFDDVKKPQDLSTCCEISRFIIFKSYRKKQETRRRIFALLVSEIKDIVYENSITSIYAVVEEWLLKSLISRGFGVRKLGNPKDDYMNTTNYPVVISLRENENPS